MGDQLESVSAEAEAETEAVSATESASAFQFQETGGSRGADEAAVADEDALIVTGKSAEPLIKHDNLETVIGIDERIRILDTDLDPWRMICALRMRGGNGAGAIGTGWLIGPKTVLTAGHCVYSTQFFGGWASTIDVIPGCNGDEQPFGKVTSTRFTSVDRWVNGEDPDAVTERSVNEVESYLQ